MTKRDIKIIEFINRFGKCNVEHVAGYFGISMLRSYQILKRLRDNGLLDYQRVFHNEKGVYTCTGEGAKMTDYEKVREVHISNLIHDLRVVSLFVGLSGRMVIDEFQTERQLRQDRSLDHFPDLMIYKDGVSVSYEVELTRKSRVRMANILDFYLKSTWIDKVVYYAPDGVFQYLKSVFSEYKMFEIYELS